MSTVEGYRPVFPRPSPTYDVNDQQNNRREIQRALDYKVNKNDYELYIAAMEERITALEARVTALENATP